jgi:hypothetical protein
MGDSDSNNHSTKAKENTDMSKTEISESDSNKGNNTYKINSDCSESSKNLTKRQRICPKVKRNDFFVELGNGNRSQCLENIVIYHQNINSSSKKKDEIIMSLHTNNVKPHFICISEHHLRKQEILHFSLTGYKLASSFCRERFLKGVCIFARNDMEFDDINLEKLCDEKTFEICAIKINVNAIKPINTIREINAGCRKITDKQEIANNFNKIFVKVARDAHKHIDMYKVLQLLKVRDTNKLEDMKVVPVTEAEVINVIGSMKGKSSTGFDGISSKILKTCASIISKPLAFVFNSSLVLGTFPEGCKYAIVRPIYKGGGGEAK